MKKLHITVLLSITLLFSGCISQQPASTGVIGEVETPTESIDSNLADETSEDTESLLDTESFKPISVHFIDVGQADSILIKADDYEVLIDGGNNGDGDLVVNYLKEQGVDELEVMIGTHVHEDHIGGLDDVLEAFKVNLIIDSGEEHTTKTFKDYAEAIELEGTIYKDDENTIIDIGSGATLQIFDPGDDYGNKNDNSVIVRLDHGSRSFLFTGDAEHETEEDLLEQGFNLDVDILKVGHHGSRTASSEKFLKAVSPQTSIISCGVDNKYNHPHVEAVERLLKYSDEVTSTHENGTIVINSNGGFLYGEGFEEISIEDGN